jgi:membrane-bound metal-dependent hydrolase YbcI (DUF457 family)
MKGIAHFTAGVAVASCFPAAVAAAEHGNPLYFILGGIFGLLPDTLDFKFYRFFYRHDIEVMPDPLDPDPQLVVDAVAYSIEQADKTGKPYRIKLNTIRLGPDLWQRYSLHFNLAEQTIEAEIGPQVDTGGVTVHAAPCKPRCASAPLPSPVKLDYLSTTHIDIFDGPMFQMVPDDDGRIIPHFIPWHRQWSHSLLVGLAFGLFAWTLWDAVAAGVIIAAYCSHIGLDQLGYMGSSLIWPLSRHRTPGLKCSHSGHAFPNFAAVWLCCLLIFWNLAYYSTQPNADINALSTSLWGIFIPLIAYRLVRKFLNVLQ